MIDEFIAEICDLVNSPPPTLYLEAGLQPCGFLFLRFRVTFSGMAVTIHPVVRQAIPGVPPVLYSYAV